MSSDLFVVLDMLFRFAVVFSFFELMFLDLQFSLSICCACAFHIVFGMVFISFAFVFFVILLWFLLISFALQSFHTTQYL